MDIETAIAIALKAHRGQTDKGGLPYILHPLAVMNRVTTLEEKIVAVLHDVVEDTCITLDVLRQEGLEEELISAISNLTKREGENYTEFIERAKNNPISRNVKIADIEENLNIFRIKEPTQKDYDRIEKYKTALEYLVKD
ncbi:GTP pyrophosphokinase [Paenibacillus methanolicus]|uniref:HD domain-containing protein n=1 Tax=Paenibacillus methanolicus TaxID=582686 RepID=A0A5S5C1S0_9BACL|nr:GTP pyrophosphokinase [Paenibacillus methanolicus]TYP72376.1 HD domain-containing protein [Paenibacillus methanolicus]